MDYPVCESHDSVVLSSAHQCDMSKFSSILLQLFVRMRADVRVATACDSQYVTMCFSRFNRCGNASQMHWFNHISSVCLWNVSLKEKLTLQLHTHIHTYILSTCSVIVNLNVCYTCTITFKSNSWFGCLINVFNCAWGKLHRIQWYKHGNSKERVIH